MDENKGNTKLVKVKKPTKKDRWLGLPLLKKRPASYYGLGRGEA